MDESVRSIKQPYSSFGNEGRWWVRGRPGGAGRGWYVKGGTELLKEEKV